MDDRDIDGAGEFDVRLCYLTLILAVSAWIFLFDRLLFTARMSLENNNKKCEICIP